MILLFTDFGWNGPYVGQMHVVLKAARPQMPVVDLMHDAPAFDPRRSAYLLAALAGHWPAAATVVAVVDPGVGSTRKPLAVQAGDCWLIGPDNGLVVPAARRLGKAAGNEPVWHEITWRPPALSASFHGRDLFAPAAARIARGDMMGLALLKTPPIGHDWPDELAEIIYRDAYGNLITGLRPKPGAILSAGSQQFHQRSTFSDAAPGKAFWYQNSMALTEIAANRGSAAAILKLSVGEQVGWC